MRIGVARQTVYAYGWVARASVGEKVQFPHFSEWRDEYGTVRVSFTGLVHLT